MQPVRLSLLLAVAVFAAPAAADEPSARTRAAVRQALEGGVVVPVTPAQLPEAKPNSAPTAPATPRAPGAPVPAGVEAARRFAVEAAGAKAQVLAGQLPPQGVAGTRAITTTGAAAASMAGTATSESEAAAARARTAEARPPSTPIPPLPPLPDGPPVP